VGINKVDFVGQTGSERSYEEGQRMPGDYEAQVSQGEITIHDDEHLGQTDIGVARYRRLLRNAIRALAEGVEPKMPDVNDDGHIPSMAGDVIVRAAEHPHDDIALQRNFGKQVGKIIESTLSLPWSERAAEIEKQVRVVLAR
jgi:hypothetical protein